MDNQGNLSQELLQRFLTRMDHIEYRLIQEQKDDVSDARADIEDVKAMIGHMQRARQLEAQDIAIADALARAPRQVPAVGSHRGPGAVAPSKAAPSPAPPGSAPTPLPAPASPEDEAAQREKVKRRGFSNLLVKSREGTPTQSPKVVTAGLAEKAPLWTEDDTRDVVPQREAEQFHIGSPLQRAVEAEVAASRLPDPPGFEPQQRFQSPSPISVMSPTARSPPESQTISMRDQPGSRRHGEAP